jgi:peptidyl-prolyl cis-trans isomerase D
MLKTMRKNVKSLKPVLWIVVATFLISIWAIWGGAGRLGEGMASNTLASVGGSKITSDEYFQGLRSRIESVKKQFSGLTSALIQQLNIPQQTLGQLIQQKLLLQVASDMGLRATDLEVRDRIVSNPVFQRDGQFVGFDDYRRILEYNHIPLKDFEDGLKQDVILNKVVSLLTAGVFVTDDEAWRNYRKQNESAKVEYLVAETAKVEIAEKPTAAQVEDAFAKNAPDYRIPEKRSGEYVFLRTEDAKKDITVQESDIEKYYRDNQSQFMEPEKVKVSRIWLPYTQADKDAVLAEARTVLERARGGADFAELAKTTSKDDKAAAGGDWGYYEWKTLSAGETEAVAGLAQGQVSDVIETEAGAAILKVTEKTPAVTKALAEVSATIKGILEDEKARDQVTRRIQGIQKQARKDKSLDLAAQKDGLKAASTGLLKKSQALGDFDTSGSISDALFGLQDAEISDPVFTYSGVGLVQLQTVEPERPATLDEVRDQVESDLVADMKKERARAKLEAAAAAIKNDWNAEASKYRLEYKTVEGHKREQYLGLVGESPEVDDLIFSLPLNEVSAPVAVSDGYAVFRVLERTEVTREDFDKVKDTEKETLLEQKRNEFLQSYLARVREDKKVRINYELFQRLTTDVLSRYGGEE